MKWYGFFNSPLKQIIYTKGKTNLKIKKTAVRLQSNLNLNFYQTFLYIPPFWNLIIFKNTNFQNTLYIYFYSISYFFFLTLSDRFLLLKFDKNTNVLILRFIFNNNYFRIFFNLFKGIFYSFSKIFFKKLKFKGKGYYIFKNVRNTIAVQLGYSHLLYIYSFFINVKFLSKTSVFMFGLNFKDILKASNNLYKIRPINIFTGKGIRFSRQIIYRKTGKLSSYR